MCLAVIVKKLSFIGAPPYRSSTYSIVRGGLFHSKSTVRAQFSMQEQVNMIIYLCTFAYLVQIVQFVCGVQQIEVLFWFFFMHLVFTN